MVILGCCAPLSWSCSKNRLVIDVPPSREHEAERLIQAPKSRDPSLTVDFFDKAIRRPLATALIPPRAIRSLVGGKIEAYNPTAEDDVSDSQWFTHRNSRRRMTLDEVARGSNQGRGPDTGGTWTVVRAKAAGVTPGFTVEDASGRSFLVKFDPPKFGELMTGAEVITSRLLHAAGYHVPETFITYFDPAMLVAGESLTITDPLGREHPADAATIQALLRNIERLPDGRVRAVASGFLHGAIGPFNFEGRRDDDPADSIPHQHRRELRGLYVLAAWLNHVDTKQLNTMDVFVEDGDDRFVRHYLIDFGSSLGSAALRPNNPADGMEYDFDLGAISARWLTAGLYTSRWERFDWEVEHPSVGFYSAELFDPGAWKGNYPNPAFQQLTTRDGYWGAKIVASFDDDQIRAAVAAGRLSDPEAAAALARAIGARRDLTVAYWFSKVTPLEDLQVRGSAGGPRLAFRDLAVSAGVVAAAGRRYQLKFDFPAADLQLRETLEPAVSVSGEGEMELPTVDVRPEFWDRLQRLPVEKRIARLELRAIAGPGADRPRSVRIYLLPDRDSGYRVVGRAY